MNRRLFLGGVLSTIGLLAGCGIRQGSFDGKVLVVGAGPAGMTAAHLLNRRGVEVEVLEALPGPGGRIRHNVDFADFPISLGGEWVHVDGSILAEIVDDPTAEITSALIPYDDSDQIALVDGDAVTFAPIRPQVFDVDTKFRGSSWLGFFETHVLPGIAGRIRFDTVATTVDHGGDRVVVTDANGVRHLADRVIVTVPLRILQQRGLTFTPPLEPARLAAIDGAVVWSGLKAFFEFDEAFYPAAIGFPDSETNAGQRLFYDAAYGQDTDQNILGVFSVGAQAEAYQAMNDEDFRLDVLGELDAAFAGAATRSYVRHLVHNWNEQPYAGAAYLEDDADPAISATLARPLGDKVFFAGDAYTSFDDWGSVHTAARSAAEAVNEVLR
jgi:monoamine oxidase